jgi:hypothetical protein
MLYPNPMPSPHRNGTSGGFSRRRLLIGGGCVAIAGAALGASFVWPADHQAVPARSIAELVDMTDPVSPGQHQVLSTTTLTQLEKLATGDAISFDLIEPSEKGPLKRIAEGRKPKDPSQASDVFENRRFLRVDNEAFIARFQQALQVIAQVKTGAPTSPIVEALWTLAQKGVVDEIELWSDCVNNATTSVNHFKPGYRFDEAMRRKLPFTGLDNLRSAKVRIYQLAINTRFQTPALQQWWEAYWGYVGAEIVSWTMVPA